MKGSHNSASPEYRFSLGPWNIGRGADPFGPPVRPAVDFDDVLAAATQLGFVGIQFHDDDAVPDLETLTPAGIDGGYTSNEPAAHRWAIERSKRAVDVALALGCDLIVLWPAREGTAVRESKNPIRASAQLLEAIDAILAASPQVRDYEALERLVLEHLLAA